MTIVVARGRTSAVRLARARRANACSAAQVGEIATAIGLGSPADGNTPAAGDRRGRLAPVVEPVASVAKRAGNKVKQLATGLADAVEASPFSDPFVLLMVGLFTLAIAALGTIVLHQLVKVTVQHDREGQIH